MALFGWIMMGIALWHFTVFLPDRFWAGIVGAFLWSVIGAVASGVLISGLSLPSQDDTNVLTILYSVQVPPFGGDTIWCNSALAYAMRARTLRRARFPCASWKQASAAPQAPTH